MKIETKITKKATLTKSEDHGYPIGGLSILGVEFSGYTFKLVRGGKTIHLSKEEALNFREFVHIIHPGDCKCR